MHNDMTTDRKPAKTVVIGWLKTIGKKLLPAVVGFALARTGILGRTGIMTAIYPFGAALAAAAPAGSVAAAMAGVLAGFLVPGTEAEPLRCAASALAVAGIKWALGELRPIRNSPFFPPAAAFAGVVLTGMVVTSSIGAAISYDLAAYLAEGAMAAAAAFFFCGAIECSSHRNSRRLSMQEMCCLVTSVCILCIPLCRLTLFGVSLPSAALMVLAVAAAVRLGPAVGAVAGVALGAVLALADGRFTSLGVIAVAVLGAALFAPLGNIAASAAFSISCSLGVLASGNVDLYLIIEAATAAVLFPLIGTQRLSFVTAWLETDSFSRTVSYSDSGISKRLSEAADGLQEALQTVSLVSEKLERIDAPKADIVCRRATEAVCADCAISGFCWGSSRDRSQTLFDSISQLLRRDGCLTAGNIPAQMKERCPKWGEMSVKINALYAEFAAGEGARHRVAQVRQAAAGQLRSCGRLMSRLAEESSRENRTGESLACRAAQILEDYGILSENVSCISRRDGSVMMEMTLRRSEEYPEPEYDAAQILADELDISFAEPDVLSEGDSVLVRLESRPLYTLEVGISQHSRGGSRLCGDVCEVMTESSAGAVVMLSDGMGTGSRAAVDAAMTCDMMRRLLDSGFGEDDAMELVNSTLQIVSGEESLVTLDCARVSLYTGRMQLTKAGAACSYLLHGDCAQVIGMDTLPLGIMNRTDCEERVIELEAGDIVIMVSDGAAGQDDDWITAELQRSGQSDMQRLSRDLLALAAARAAACDDDITVIAFRLEYAGAEEENQAA